MTIDGHTKLDLTVDDYLVIKRSPFNVPCKTFILIILSCALEQREPGLDLEHSAVQTTEVEQAHRAETLQEAGSDQS